MPEWEKDAMSGKAMPGGLTPEEQLAFQSLSVLYARFRSGAISREQGTRDKGKIMYEPERRQREHNTLARLLEHHNKIEQVLPTAASLDDVKKLFWGNVT